MSARGARAIVDHQSRSDIAIRGGDERFERQFVDSSSRRQLHMSHVLAGAHQKRCAIRQTGTVEEAHVDVGKDAGSRLTDRLNRRSPGTM